jgi:hypothetical protein
MLELGFNLFSGTLRTLLIPANARGNSERGGDIFGRSAGRPVVMYVLSISVGICNEHNDCDHALDLTFCFPKSFYMQGRLLP